MDVTPAPRGADPVNDEFEVGYDAVFERGWRIAELTGRVVMVAVLLAALAGLLGRGPFSHRSHATADGQLSVDFEPVARFGVSTQVTLHLSSPVPPANAAPAGANQVRVFVSSAIVEPMGLQFILPSPVDTEAVGGGVVYAFNVPPGQGSALVRFVLKPSVSGPVRLFARQGAERLGWTQWILP